MSNNTGFEAFKKLMAKRKAIGHNPAMVAGQKSKLFVEYARSKYNGTQKAKPGTVWYHADIKHYDSDGHLNTGKTVFLISISAEKMKGKTAVEQELNQIVSTKMKALIELHKNS